MTMLLSGGKVSRKNEKNENYKLTFYFLQLF